MEQRVTIAVTDGVADVRLARPDKLNALDDAMFAGLIEAGEQLADDRAVRAVVLSGEGRAFCAGLDAGKFGRMSDGALAKELVQQSHGPANHSQQAVLVWRELPVPVIAAVRGARLRRRPADRARLRPALCRAGREAFDHGDQVGPGPGHGWPPADAPVGA